MSDRRSSAVDLRRFTVSELLGLFSDVLEELRQRGVARSDNIPTADYAEFLVAEGLGLELTGRSNHGFDAVGSHGAKYEVKARRVTRRGKSPPHFGVIRGLPDRHFDWFVGLVFERDFTVGEAWLLPHESVVSIATYKRHTNGWRVRIDDRLSAVDGARDVTQRLREVQRSGG